MRHMDLDSIEEGWKVWGVWCVDDMNAEDYRNHGHFIDNYATEAEAIDAWNMRTLGGGECEMAFGDDMLPECGNCGEPLVYYTLRHGFDGKDKRSASFCPRCGKAVKR